MAWLDPRFWCHPKVLGLTDRAALVYVKGLSYSDGMNTKGHLDPPTQRLLGGNSTVRRQLVDAGLWDPNGNGESVLIHDWDDHNAGRDAKKERDRERKRDLRKQGRLT